MSDGSNILDYTSLDPIKLKGMQTNPMIGDTNNNSQGFMSNIFGKDGWGVPVMQGIGSLANIYFGAKNLGLAQDQFEMQSGLARTNLANQAKLTNMSVLEAERGRLRSTGMSASDINARMKAYSDKYKVSGKIGE